MVLLIWLPYACSSQLDRRNDLSVGRIGAVLRREPFALQKAVLFRATALRFRMVVWGAIAVLLPTGPLLLHQRGIPIAAPSEWPMTLSVSWDLRRLFFSSP